MKKLLLLLLFPFSLYSQNYTSYFTGNPNDTSAAPAGGICLMGGASEDDNGMRWFLQQANGGDILVLRTSGSNGYNSYLYSSLGVPVNSVETIVCNNAAASNEPYVLQKIQQAEGIWFAGGDQWDYISYWRGTPVDSLINIALQQRHIVIGGTSAGMAIQGGYYFSAQNGTVTSSDAMNDPFDSRVTVDSTAFLSNNHLQHVITDTHFDNPDRRGRLVTFLARIYTDYGIYATAIACDEYTAVCIDTAGIAHVYGGYPTYDDNAYFIQSNCELTNRTPETCSTGISLTWDRGGEAVKVYEVKGTSGGQNTFDLNTWQTGTGGSWLNWSVNNGAFISQNGNPLNCNNVAVSETNTLTSISTYPNPVLCGGSVIISSPGVGDGGHSLAIFNSLGEEVAFEVKNIQQDQMEIHIDYAPAGIYFIRMNSNDGSSHTQTLIVQ